jgi:misacylated tRNA(Ala) deacylase
MTLTLFRDDAYLRSAAATVVAVTEQRGVVLDRTPFYASAGGQPGDRGAIVWPGARMDVATTVYDSIDRSRIVHVAAEGAPLPAVGALVTADIDWPLRHRLMRMHTALHLMCSLVRFPVTGGQIGPEESRLDFDIEDASAVDKDGLTASLRALVAADHPVGTRWITEAELDAEPGLVRTLSVQPPRGSGRIRLVAIGHDGMVDLQPCGGTHVRSTAEIGSVVVSKIEKKGKINRRIRVVLE